MGYQKIPNLYKNQEILLFKECFCLEKADGTSSNISWDGTNVSFFAGGASHDRFVDIFNVDRLTDAFREHIGEGENCRVYGECIGGKIQGMSKTYGTNLCFVAFEVKINDAWLSVPNAEDVVKKLGLEFVHYVKVPTDLETLNRERDRDSVQAIRNGMGEGHPSEGVVLRPLIEMTLNNGRRVIAKHKKDKFRETKTPRAVLDPDKLSQLKDAQAIAEEWVTPIRLQHVADAIGLEPVPENIRNFIPAMIDDIEIEAGNEVQWSPSAKKAVGSATAKLIKKTVTANACTTT